MSSPAPVYEQPVGRWGTSWRLALMLLISSLAWWEIAQAEWNGTRWLFWLDLAGGLVAFASVWWRRRWPVQVALLTVALGLFSASSAGAGALAFVSLATHRRLAQIVPVGLISVVTGQLYFYYSPSGTHDPPWLNFTMLTAVTVAAAALGMYIGSRRELIWSLRERAAANEAQQTLREEQARSHERERIAREMHDVLAHRISLITMHSGALAYRTDLPPEQVRETAQLISDTSHEALTDLREVLGALRRSEPMRPQPSLGDIPELAREDGGGVEVAIAVPTEAAVPERIGRTAYRIVQEALTNARKHAPGQPVRVVIGGAPGAGLTINVRNPRSVRGPAPAVSSGFGLVGMRERVELAGGRLSIASTDAFDLEAWLPWTT